MFVEVKKVRRAARLSALSTLSAMLALCACGGATFAVTATDFQAKNLTIANDYVKGSFAGSNQSAVALMTQGDKIVLENVRLLGHQDMFYMKSAKVDQVARVYVKNSYIEVMPFS